MSTKIIVGSKKNPVRFSYAHVFEPTSINEGDDKKYSVSIIVSKDDKATIKKIKDAIEAAKEEGKGKFGGKIPKKLKQPLRDGDEDREDDSAYENSLFVNANSARKPQIVDAELEEIMSQDEFYSGCYGRASITFYAYDAAGSKGIACGLNNLQKLDDGERLGGSVASAEEDFGDDDDDNDIL
jgi:hypothetical protein